MIISQAMLNVVVVNAISAADVVVKGQVMGVGSLLKRLCCQRWLHHDTTTRWLTLTPFQTRQGFGFQPAPALVMGCRSLETVWSS